MATYSNNTTIKIDGGMISASMPSSATNLFYTVPANSYLKLSGFGSASIATSPQGSVLYICPSGSSYSFINFAELTIPNSKYGAIFNNEIYCPAGTKLYILNSTGTTTFYLLGQLFTNTP